MNTVLTVAATKGMLPEVYSATRPMWPQRPTKPTQIQDPKLSSIPQKKQLNPSTSHTISVLQNPYTVTSSRSPVLIPGPIQFDPHQNFMTQEHNPTLQSNSIDRRIVIADSSSNNFGFDNPIVSHGDGTIQSNNYLPNNGNNVFMIPSEYLNSVPSSGFPIVFPGPMPSVPVTQYPVLMSTPENNILPPIFPAPLPFAPMTYPPFIASPPNMLPFNSVTPNVVIINPSQSACQCDEKQVATPPEITNTIPDTSNPGSPVVQSNPEIQHVPYNLEINVPVLTRIIPTSEPGSSLPEFSTEIPSSPTLPPFMNYPPVPFPPPPPFLPPIIIQGPKSKSKDLLKILLISQFLPFGFASGNNCDCGDSRYVPVPYPIPFSTNNPIILE